MPKVKITPLKQNPDVIDEIKFGSDVHIERMHKREFWMRIGEDHTFRINVKGRINPEVVITLECDMSNVTVEDLPKWED